MILVLFFFIPGVSSKRTLLGGLVTRAHLLLLQFDVICLVAKRNLFVNDTTVDQSRRRMFKRSSCVALERFTSTWKETV